MEYELGMCPSPDAFTIFAIFTRKFEFIVDKSPPVSQYIEDFSMYKS